MIGIKTFDIIMRNVKKYCVAYLKEITKYARVFFKRERYRYALKKVVASDKNHRPCLPLKPQEKSLLNIFN